MRTCPAVGCSKPAISLRHVVLPEPEGPSMAKNSPATISRSTPSTARTWPKWRETLLKETAEVIGVSVSQSFDAAGRCVGNDGVRLEHPSSDLASRGHLLPQGEKGERCILVSANRQHWRFAASYMPSSPSPLVGEGSSALRAETDEGCSSLAQRMRGVGRSATSPPRPSP